MIITRTPLRISFFGGGTDFPEWYEKNENALIGFFSGLVLLSIPLLWKVDPWAFIVPISDISIYLGFFLGLLSMLVLKKLNF